jgi:hypothetical protein
MATPMRDDDREELIAYRAQMERIAEYGPRLGYIEDRLTRIEKVQAEHGAMLRAIMRHIGIDPEVS